MGKIKSQPTGSQFYEKKNNQTFYPYQNVDSQLTREKCMMAIHLSSAVQYNN